MEKKEFYRKKITEKKCCVIIPTYNNCKTLDTVISGVLAYTQQIIVVNDGSTDDTENILKKHKNIDIISYSENKGKGYALRKGFDFARKKGYNYAITIDSDGQHFVDDIPVFLDKLQKEPDAIIVGARNMIQESVPRKSSFGNKLSNFWFKFETGINLPDTQSGFRLYPLKPIENIKFFTKKFEFEIEVMVRAAWKGIKLISVPVRVYYAPKQKRISHFRPINDFLRVSLLNICLVFIAVIYIKPFQFLKILNRKNIKDFIDKHTLLSNESNIKITLAVMLGLFMGVAPIWGFQLITAVALAFIFKLNKLIVFVVANISVPPIIPVIIYFSYKIGGIILGNNAGVLEYSSAIDIEFIKNNILQYIAGSLCLGIILSSCLGLITYLSLMIFRKKKL